MTVVLLLVLVASCHTGSQDSPIDSGQDSEPPVDADSSSDGDADEDTGEDFDAALDATADTAPDAEGPPITVSLDVESNPRCSLTAIARVTTARSSRVAIEVERSDGTTWRTGLTSTGLDHVIDVVGMRAETSNTMRAVAFVGGVERGRSEQEVFTTGALPEGIPDFDVIVHEPDLMQTGFTIISPYEFPDSRDPTFYIAVDDVGEIVWYYPIEILTRRVSSHVTQLSDGTLLVITDNGLRVITIGGETRVEITAEMVGVVGFHHEGIQLPSGRFMTLTNEKHTLYVSDLGGDVSVTGDRILEFDRSGEIVWEWSTFDHLDLTRFPDALSRSLDSRGNYQHSHSNAIVYDEVADTLLLSVRHQHWILNIDHVTGDIIWRLGMDGDFTLLDHDPEAGVQWFYGQHAPEVQADGTILIYDNGNERPDTPTLFSRGVIYELDEAALEAEQIWQYETDYYTSFVGDADRLPNGNILLCAGGTARTGAGEPAQLIEVTGSLDPVRVWELVVFERVMFRATRISSFYPEPTE